MSSSIRTLLCDPYCRALAILRLAPGIALIAAAGEALQHAVEYRFGMFKIGDGLAPGFETDVRLGFGAIKALAVVCSIVLTARLAESASSDLYAANRTLETGAPTFWLVANVVPFYLFHYALNKWTLGLTLAPAAALLALDCGIVALLAIGIGIALGDTRRRRSRS